MRKGPETPDTNPSRDIGGLLEIMERLRKPDTGCPWDLKQNFASIAPYTIEEAYEVADAIERQDMSDLTDELGDLLLQVVFHAQIASEAGAFDFGDVVEAITGKMIRRHPHVFGDDAVNRRPHDVLKAWEEIKAEEDAAKSEADGNGNQSEISGVAIALPALLRAQKLQGKAANAGFDWRDAEEIYSKISEEIAEVKEATQRNSETELEEEIGDLLFSVVNLSRRLGIDAEKALRAGNAKFERRFRAMEEEAREYGRAVKTLTIEEMEPIWQSVKRNRATS